MKLDLSELNGLSETDLEQIDQWLDEFSYRKTVRLASEKFNRPIDKNTVQRFATRAAPKDFLDDSPEAQETAGQILQFAATGQPQFTEAVVHVLEQTAFKLTFSCTHRVEDMKALQQISTMLFRHRNAAVRERLAKVQEQKLQLRREELQGHGILPRKLPRLAPMDPAWIARKTTEFQQRFPNLSVVVPTASSSTVPVRECEPGTVIPTASSDTATKAMPMSQEPAGFNSNRRGLSPRNPRSADNTDSTPAGVQQPTRDESAEPTNHISEPEPSSSTELATQLPDDGPSPELQAIRRQFLSLLKAKPDLSSAVISNDASSITAYPQTAAVAGPSLSESQPIVQNPAPSVVQSILGNAATIVPLSLLKGEGQGEGSPQSESANQKSKIQNTADYTHRRSEEYNQWKADHGRAKLGCPSAYFTQIPGCPCGKPLQCPDHPWPGEFLSMNPDHPEYEQALAKNGLSCRLPAVPG
jgi:hypothetical protein